MILDKVLILKGLGGLTVLGGSGLAVYFAVAPSDDDSSKAKELKKSLGLPEDDNVCKLPTTNNSHANCTLDADKLKAIKFEGKTDTTSSITVTGGTVNLKITKTSDTTTYPKGYKFTFENTNDLSIPKSTDNESISIKKGTNTEFRIKETPSTTDGTAKTLSLEKAWNITEWGKKVGLTNCATTGDQKQCDLGDKINLFISASDKTEEATITGSNKKIKYEEDSANHNQGFKFTADSEICLTSGTTTKKIEASTAEGNPTYEIKEIGGKWYLSKKTTANAS